MAQKGILTQVPIGTVFGRLTTTSQVFQKPSNSYIHTLIVAVCTCGNEKEYRIAGLRSGKTQSCGCLRIELLVKKRKTHGLRNHPLNHVWCNIKQRCENKNHPRYKDWGGRGITICEEWRNDFQAFHDWCIANGWKKGLQIDRKENDGNYEPSNCRCTTSAKNNQNRRDSKFVYHQILTIRNLFKMGAFTKAELGRIYKTHKSNISKIVENKSWAY